jgi:putative ubiquitin-RnfH superfamily antitoxin RatB of RatAB toxin-antitoxin module
MAAIRVEVVYALPASAQAVELRLPAGSRVRDAIAACGLAAPVKAAVGVFGKRVGPDTPLADGDRVELYRPLQMDPKERRRQRARRRARR